MMHVVCCADVQDRLDEFHDGELPLEDRVAIQGHLRDCVTCALAASELEEIRLSLRDMAHSLPDRSDPEADHLAQQVTERWAQAPPRSAPPELEERFRNVLGTIETVFEDQRRHLLEDEVLDLDVQIEVLSRQLGREGGG